MDLRHNQLPWSEQIWAKINADLAQALAQSRRVRAPFEVFQVPSSTQTVMADKADDNGEFDFSETTTTPVVQLSVDFRLRESQVFNEGENFFALDRIVEAAHRLGHAEDWLLIRPNSDERLQAFSKSKAVCTQLREFWDGLYYPTDGTGYQPGDIPLFVPPVDAKDSVGVALFRYVVAARQELRKHSRYEPYALILSNDLEGEISSTVRGSNSLNTPVERMRPLVTAGIHSTPALPDNTALVVSASRAWVDIAQAMEPSVQFVRIGENGVYEMRLVERFAFRLKDRRARCKIEVRTLDLS